MKFYVSYFLLVFFFSCRQVTIKSVDEVFEAIGQPEQVNEIDPSKDNLIECKKGTKVFIPANSLVYSNGAVPTCNATVIIKEFSSIAEMLSGRLSTTSDTELLETNGMLFISASAEGKELTMSMDKSYVVAFPKKQSVQTMSLFYGDTSTKKLNWLPDEISMPGEGFGIDSGLIDSSLYKKSGEVCGWMSKTGDDTILWKMKHRDSTFFRYVENNFTLPENLLDEFCKTYHYHFENDITIFLNKQGKVEDVRFDSIDQKFHSGFSSFLKEMPAFDMGSMGRYRENGYSFRICCANKFDTGKYNERFRKKYSNYKERAIQRIEKADLKYFIFSVTRFGWINCDRFLYNKQEKINFTVRLSNHRDAFAMLVFSDMKSVMNGTTTPEGFSFANIPKGQKAKIVCISYQEGKPLIAIKEIIVSAETVELPAFKAISISELEETLQKL